MGLDAPVSDQPCSGTNASLCYSVVHSYCVSVALQPAAGGWHSLKNFHNRSVQTL